MASIKDKRFLPKNQQEAAAWMLARRHMKYWCMLNGFRPAPHHELLIQAAEDILARKNDRLMVFMPPGSAKSTYLSDLFQPVALHKWPKAQLIACSHTQELAESFGRRVRNRIQEKGHILQLELSPDSQAAGRWGVIGGGNYFSVGVGGAVTGIRGDIITIDDPVRSAEDADSKLVRDKTWDWYQFDLMTRLKPHGAVILVMTRWHEDDLAGRILQAEPGRWKVIRLPMLAEDEKDPLNRKPGELLWPDYFTQQMVAGAKRNPRVWSALYQQRPAPEEGGFFKAEWLKGYAPSELPKNLRIYLASDHAVSTKQTADKTCILAVGVCEQGFIWVLPDSVWGRLTAEESVEEALNLVAKRKPLTWWAERGHITQSIGPFLRKRMMERCIYTSIVEVTPAKDKQTRAQSIHGRAAMGLLRVPKFAPWWPDAEHELLSFPTGAHDDFVDALSWVGLGLDGVVSARQPKPPEARPKPFTGAWLQQDEEYQERERQKHLATAGW